MFKQSLLVSVLLFGNVAMALPASNDNVAHQLLGKAPVQVVLPVGKEKRLSFPFNVSVLVDETKLPQSTLALLNNQGTLYITAHKAFPTTRIEVKNNVNGKIYLMDLSASANGNNTEVDLLSPNVKAKTQDQHAVKHFGLPGLMRYAVQQLYAPERLLTEPSNIFRAPMQAHKSEPLVFDGSLTAMPIASWGTQDKLGQNIYATAIEVTNNLKQPLSIDPRRFCGDWLASSVFPRMRLGTTGIQKSTSVFLISSVPFGQAISQCREG